MYKIISNPDAAKLAETVSGFINDGWYPQGGISTAVVGNKQKLHYTQAIVYPPAGKKAIRSSRPSPKKSKKQVKAS